MELGGAGLEGHVLSSQIEEHFIRKSNAKWCTSIVAPHPSLMLISGGACTSYGVPWTCREAKATVSLLCYDIPPPPTFAAGLEPRARVTLYLNDENMFMLGDLLGRRSVAIAPPSCGSMSQN